MKFIRQLRGYTTMNNEKITYSNKGFNSAQINATAHIVIEAQKQAQLHNNLPHNSFVMTNQSTTCTLYIFLDDFSNQDNPNYVLFPTQTISVSLEDGVSFTTMFIKNTHASTVISAKEIKYNIMTIKKGVV